MPKISVIIPVYNAEKYLNKTLESILKQSLKDIEVICVDDGSTDGSVEIIQSFIKKDDRVKLIRQNNQHAGSARNTGLKEAQGEYIHFMDADDYVLNYAYEAIYNKVIKYDLDCLKFSSVVYDVKQKDTVDLPAFTLTRLRPGDFNRLLTLEEGDRIHDGIQLLKHAAQHQRQRKQQNQPYRTAVCHIGNAHHIAPPLRKIIKPKAQKETELHFGFQNDGTAECC